MRTLPNAVPSMPESINRKLAKALVRLAPSELELSELSFKDLPLYSYAYDADFPSMAKALLSHAARRSPGATSVWRP